MKNKKHNWENAKCNWKSRKQSCGAMKRSMKNKKHIWRSIKCDWDCILDCIISLIEIVILLISLNVLMKLGTRAALCGVGISISFLLACRNRYK